MTLLWLAVRSHRTGLAAMAIGGALTGGLNAAAFVEVAGTTPAERAAFGTQMELLARQLTYLLPNPVQLDTMGGYLTWRAFGILGLLFAIWAILAATGAGRGEEERGLTEHWLATGVSRLRWLATRTAGFVTAAFVAVAVTMAVTAAASGAVGEPLPVPGLALQGLALLGVTLAAFGIGLAAAQLVVTRRSAGSIGVVLVIALYVLNAASRSGMGLGAIENASPFTLYERSAPLLLDGRLDVAATLALYAMAAALVALSMVAFRLRDVGGPLFRTGTGRHGVARRPSSDPLLRLPVLAMISQQRWSLFGWTAGLALFAYFMTSIARTIVDSMMGIASLRVYFERLGVAAYSDFVGVLWFGTGLFILSGLAIVQTSSWAADDAEGRLEAMLASGASRARVVLERVAAILVITGVVAAVSSAIVFYTARALDITLPGDRMALATVLVLPVTFAFAGIGAAFVGWRPRAAVVLLGTVAIASYFLQQFAAIFGWPEWLAHASIYELYGMPLSRDDWPGAATLVAIGVAGTAIAIVSMQRRDVGS